MIHKQWLTADSPGVEPKDRDALNMALYSADETFFVSYVHSMAVAREAFKHLVTVPADIPDGPETCLVLRGTGLLGHNEYFPLPGDHREAYEKVIDQGFAACYDYYLSKKTFDD